jgi:thioredoxin-like negative regulator of GroEL
VSADAPHADVVTAAALDSARPTLVFVRDARSGPSRRMDSLVAWVRVTRKRQLRVVDVEASSNPEVLKLLQITSVPALALLQEGRVVGRLEGKATGDQIEELIRPYVEDDAGS